MPFKIPHSFKYKLRNSQKEYRRDPPGTPDVAALIANKPYWVSPASMCVDKQKTLVLADWTASRWPSDKKKQVIMLIGELMDQGFAIYMWYQGNVRLLDKAALSTPKLASQLDSMTFASTQDIAKAAVTQNKLTLDELQIIDDYWLDHILSGKEEPGPRIIRTSELPDFQIHTLANILNSSTPKIDKIIHDVFSEKTNKNAKLLKEQLGDIPIECNYTRAALGDTGEDVFTEMSLSELTLTNEQLKNLKIIDFNPQVSIKYLQALLKTTAKLEQINLTNCQNLAEALVLEVNSLKELKEITLSDSNISMQNLQALLKAAPNLEQINLTNCQNLAEALVLEVNSLKELKEITLSDSNISMQNLQALLKASPNLEQIALGDCNDLAEALVLEVNSLNKLKAIDLWGNTISRQSLQVLLKAAPNLEKCCTDLAEALALEANNLRELKEITLSDSNISMQNLQALLKASPNLEQITLEDCNDLAEALVLEVSSLKELKTITLCKSNISGQNLQELLKAAPKLETINLTRCTDLAEALVLEANSLKELKKIILSDSNISGQNLQELLKAAPKLETINLTRCTDLAEALVLEANSLKELKTITLSDSNISGQNLQELLKIAPKLETINLTRCTDLAEALVLEVNSLKELKTITLSDSNISGQNLQELLKAAPKLETINLTHCTDLAEALVLEANSLKELKTITLSNSNISGRKLQELLKAVPNLEKIDLSSCTDLAEALVLEANSLKELKTIALSNSNISMQNLQALLKAAPNLESIRLRSCSNLTGELELEENSLNQLKRMYCFKTDISMKNWETILQAAPNIRLGLSSSRVSQSSVTPSNPTHDPNKMKEFKPTPENKPFQFKNTNKTKNQGMIIAKLCQYFTLKQEYLDLIPKIQDGICVALSNYFSSLDQNEWDNFVGKVLAWNGESNSLDKDLITHFNSLYNYIQKYQLRQQADQYLGDALKSFLDTNNKPCILSNPWHSIAIKPDGDGNWYVYDPNYVTGYLKVPQDKLLETIHTAIGAIVLVGSDKELYQCALTDLNAFIEHGGLLAMCDCSNAADMLSKLPKDYAYTKKALDGLLLRSTSGKPAWVCGLGSNNTSIAQFTQRLINLFQQVNKDADEQLAKSMDALPPQKKAECITAIVKTSNSQNAFQTPRDSLIAAIRTSERQGLYEKALRTWDKTAEGVPTPMKYYQQCLSSAHKKRLIELESTQQVDSLRLQLEHHAANISRPIFYIDSPDDLVCSAPWMKRNDNNIGELQKSPGGPLYEFLQENKDKTPLLIVNYERFNADDLVRFNGLLDKEPNADGTPLPAKTTIIGLINRNKPDCYQGSDFYSRFNRTELCPLTEQQLDALKLTRRVSVSTQKIEGSTLINLYHTPNWKDKLLGHWVLNGDTFELSEGELVNAIKLGRPIEIQNGFWGDKEFERFWQQILTGGVRHAGRLIQIPKHINVVRPEIDIYEWSKIPQIEEGLLADEKVAILNPTSLVNFFGPYELVGNKLLKKQGLIEHAKQENKPLVVNVTRSLGNDAWAMLMAECNRLGVELKVHCAKGVEFPEEFAHQTSKSVAHKGIPLNLSEDFLIISTDIDTTVSMMTKKQDASIVIDVSECTASDLLVKLDGKLNKETLKFEFSQSNGALTTALLENKNIILKGRFSPELLDSLAPVLQTRKQSKAGGQIVLVTDDEQAGAFLSNRYAHSVSMEEKLACFPSDKLITDRLVDYLDAEPLSKLQTRYHFLKSNPQETNSDDAWFGMSSLPISTNASTAILDKKHSAEDSSAFTKERLVKVNAVLDSMPYVFLTGLSGVGKSTFVEKELCNNDALYLTEERIESWASDQSNRRKILFIDEANLSSRQWSEFEGLFNKPPSVLVNGKFHILTPEHKVVFAGNPVSYGDERTLAPFFQSHGNAVLFTPLPPAVIYEEILKPVVTNTGVELDPLADHILETYRFICNCSSTEVLITPRELQMMALLTITYSKNHPDEDIKSIAENFSYELAKNLVPKEKRAAFDAQFTPKHPIIGDQPKQGDNFLVTPSRKIVTQQLNDLLDLRQWRCDKTLSLNTVQKTGGLGGLIIQGEPGIGKSELVITELLARNYTEEKDFGNPTTKDNLFYRMPVSMALDEKEKLLIKAFNEGAVVIIDEVNSSPMMERLLNDLLMGKNPKGKIGDNVKPGFMVIGTQNPVTMAGRRIASTALQRRLITTELPEYTSDEMKTILSAKGVDSFEADAMIVAYENNRLFAIKNKLSPIPNFRNLITVAEELRSLTKESNEPKATDQLLYDTMAEFIEKEELKDSSPETDQLLDDEISELLETEAAQKEDQNKEVKTVKLDGVFEEKAKLPKPQNLDEEQHQQLKGQERERQYQQFIREEFFRINHALGTLQQRISRVDQHHSPNAFNNATSLLQGLQNAQNDYSAALNQPGVIVSQAMNAFKDTCSHLIEDAKPLLENDLGWGDYLSNLLKTILNAIIWIGSFGQRNSFFPLERSQSIIAIEEAEQGLVFG